MFALPTAAGIPAAGALPAGYAQLGYDPNDPNIQALFQAQALQAAYAQAAAQQQAAALASMGLGGAGAMLGIDPATYAQLASVPGLLAQLGLPGLGGDPNAALLQALGLSQPVYGLSQDQLAVVATSEPPAKRPRGAGPITTTLPEGTGEVRFETAAAAQTAKEMLDGKQLLGSTIRVVPDLNSADGTKILVFDLPEGCIWPDLKEFFSPCGNVIFCNVGGGEPGSKGPGKGDGSKSSPVGEVRFEKAEEAAESIQRFHGKPCKGKNLIVEIDRTSIDGTRVLIYNMPDDLAWYEIKDMFSAIGKILYCGIRGDKGAGKGRRVITGPTLSERLSSLVRDPPKVIPPPSRPGEDIPVSSVFTLPIVVPNPAAIEPDETYSIGEVTYFSADMASQAITQLTGAFYRDHQITVEQDLRIPAGTKVLVRGLPAKTSWQDLKDFFSSIGAVHYAGVTPPNPPPFVNPTYPEIDPTLAAGEIRFDRAEHAKKAVEKMNAKDVNGSTIAVRLDETVPDSIRIFVYNLPHFFRWQDLKDFFSANGVPVAFADVHQPAEAAAVVAPPRFVSPIERQYGPVVVAPPAQIIAPPPKSAEPRASNNVWEVTYYEPKDAMKAIRELDGSLFKGFAITVKQDEAKMETVLVTNLPVATLWQELKDHFEVVAPVSFAGIREPDGKGKGGKSSEGEGKGLLQALSRYAEGKGEGSKGSSKGSDAKGYDAKGYESKGYDSKGYDSKGYDSKGYDGNGYDGKGYDYKGYDYKGYDSKGYGSKGYDSKGYDYKGKGYDYKGYDSKGYDSKGYDAKGYDYKGYGGKGKW